MNNPKYIIPAIILIVILGFIACPKRDRESRERVGGTSERIVKERDTPSVNRRTSRVAGASNTVKMEEYGGVWEIPVYINDVKMNFIFDTGAGMISISLTELGFLAKQGAVTEEDVIRVQNFIDANGDVSEGLVINLKTVQIADRVLHDVEASVVNNEVAPLLLGQSALARFGKFTVDYGDNTITFE